MHRQLLFVFFAVLFFSSCERAPEEASKPEPDKQPSAAAEASVAPSQEMPVEQSSAPAVGPVDLMNEPIQLQRFESVAEALPVWRQFANQQPALLLLSGSPQLIPPPTDLLEQVDYLASKGDSTAIRDASLKSNPAALMHPSMALDIALRNQWFREWTWLLPMRDPSLSPDLEAIQSQFTERAMLSPAEVDSLVLDQQVLTGSIRNLPFRAHKIAQPLSVAGPVIVHIDLGYFQALYKNEIATPILKTIYQTLATLKEQHIEIHAVTFAYGHLDNQIALDVRFVGEILATLFAHPELLSKPVPANWQRQADSIYLSNFFEKERIDALHKAQEQDDPDAAWVKFSLFRAAAAQKQGEEALDYLAEAVARDPMYAYEYGNLARLAYEHNRPDETLRMFSLATRAFPDDPFIKLRMAELAIELGDSKTALHLVEQLSQLNWSPYYHRQMPDYLENLKNRIEEVMSQEGAH